MSDINSNLLIEIRNNLSTLSPILEKVGKFVAKDPDFVMRHTITEVAGAIETSEGSITRFCRAFGFKGFSELRTTLALGQGAKQLENPGEDEYRALYDSIRDTNKIIDCDELSAAAEALHAAVNIDIYAIGLGAPLALFLQLNLIRMGKPANFVERLYQSVMAGSQRGPNDLIIAIHASEVSADMLHELAIARQNGVRLLSITKGTFHPFVKLSDWNLQAAVSCSSVGERGFAEIAGTLMVIDRLTSELEKLDDGYRRHRLENQKTSFSMETITSKLVDYFMS